MKGVKMGQSKFLESKDTTPSITEDIFPEDRGKGSNKRIDSENLILQILNLSSDFVKMGTEYSSIKWDERLEIVYSFLALPNSKRKFVLSQILKNGDLLTLQIIWDYINDDNKGVYNLHRRLPNRTISYKQVSPDTLLTIAIQNNDERGIDFLLERMIPDENYLHIYYAVLNKNLRALKKLHELGGSLYEEKNIAIHIASTLKPESIALDFCKYFVSQGVPPDSFNWISLSNSIEYENYEVFKYLANDHKVDISFANYYVVRVIMYNKIYSLFKHLIDTEIINRKNAMSILIASHNIKNMDRGGWRFRLPLHRLRAINTGLDPELIYPIDYGNVVNISVYRSMYTIEVATTGPQSEDMLLYYHSSFYKERKRYSGISRPLVLVGEYVTPTTPLGRAIPSK